MCRDEGLYKLLVVRLTRHDPVPVKEPDFDEAESESGWRKLYHALYHRERNWAWGNPQGLKCVRLLAFESARGVRTIINIDLGRICCRVLTIGS